MTCLDETTLALFLDRQLAGERVATVEHHIDNCTTCRRLLGELARGRTDPGLSIAPTQPATRPTQPPGDRVDRYLLLRVLGAGAMGTVYAAYDPVLDRKVAVKLLHAQATTPEGRARLMREAQALARVASPHVVTIHDVGVTGDQIYIAMELVEGGTLRRWLRDSPRHWREVVALFAAAGRGLAAAHARGLVHRDFKPDNVLIHGERVCVADFGLAAVASDFEAPADSAPETSTLDHVLTRTGAVVGTPAYMAPEVLDGDTADARSDQFSFCVSLYEAIYGERPFRGRTVDELRDAIKAGELRPASRAVPAGLRAAVVRGLAADPAQRHVSIDELLARIARIATRRRRALFAGAAVVLAAASATVAITVTRGSDDPCRGADALPDRPYDPIELRVGFTTATPDGAAAADHVLARLEGWRHEVAAMRARACRAVEIEHVETPELFDLRMACVARATARVRTLAAELAHPTPAAVDGALPAIDRATDLEPCRATADLRLPGRPTTASARTLETGLTQQLAQADATMLAGHYPEARDQAAAVAAQAARAGLGDVEARAWELVGRAETVSNQWLAGEASYRKAIAAAERSGSDRLRARLYVALSLIGIRTIRYDDAERWLDQASSLIERLQIHELDWAIAWQRSTIAYQRNDSATAVALGRRAIDLYTRDHATENHQLALLWNSLGPAQGGDEGRRSMDRAIAIGKRVLGAHHPGMIDLLTTRGGFEVIDGKPDAAIPFLQHAVAIAQELAGRDPTLLATAAQMLAFAYMQKQRFSDARMLLDRALPLTEHSVGARTEATANLYAMRGECLAEIGRPEDAIADKLHALEIKRAVLPADAPEIAQSLEWLGRTQRSIKHFDEALRSYQDALAIRGRQTNSDASRSMAELGIGSTLIDAGKPNDAIVHLERAVELAARPGEHDDTVVPEAHANLGRAYLLLHQSARAVPLLEQAKREYTPLATEDDVTADLDEVNRMLAEVKR